MTAVARLQHAMLYVTDLARSVDFYHEALGLEETWRDGPIALMRAVGSTNHHDLALLAVGEDAHRPPSGSVGLYHLAWEVWTIDELAAAAAALSAMRALTGASDHGAIKSVYGRDPDGIEFEIDLGRAPALLGRLRQARDGPSARPGCGAGTLEPARRASLRAPGQSAQCGTRPRRAGAASRSMSASNGARGTPRHRSSSTERWGIGASRRNRASSR